MINGYKTNGKRRKTNTERLRQLLEYETPAGINFSSKVVTVNKGMVESEKPGIHNLKPIRIAGPYLNLD